MGSRPKAGKGVGASHRQALILNGGFNYLISGVPYDTTPVEKRALRDTLEQFTARHTHLVHEPLAAALGMGLNIQEPEGKLVVDIGVALPRWL